MKSLNCKNITLDWTMKATNPGRRSVPASMTFLQENCNSSQILQPKGKFTMRTCGVLVCLTSTHRGLHAQVHKQKLVGPLS